MKQFIYKLSTFFIIPIIIIIGTVNYLSDPANLFANKYEKRMAEITNEGKNIINATNFDERVYQKEIIVNSTICPDLIFIGSSRGMLINNNMFNDMLFFNNAVSGASIEDLIAIYELRKSSNKLPKKIIIGIDPWTFNENNGQNRWKSLLQEYNSFHNKPLLINYSHFYLLKELFSFSYFISSLHFIPKAFSRKQPSATEQTNNIGRILLKDGSIEYGVEYKNSNKQIIDERVNEYLNGNLYAVEKFNVISKRIWTEFEKLISEIRARDIDIIFYLEPCHPKVYQRIKKEYPMVIKTEDIIIDFAKKNKFKMIGTFDPSKYDLNEDDFYDGIHCKERAVKKIVKSEI